MLTVIDNSSFSPGTYHKGTMPFFSMEHLSPELVKMYKDGLLSKADVIKLNAIATPEVMSPGLW